MTIIDRGTCWRLSLDTRAESEEARKSAQRKFGTSLQSENCSQCHRWHITFAKKLTARELAVLYQFCMGFRAREIRDLLEFETTQQVHNTVFYLAREVGALSRSHLVAAAIQFGVVNLLERQGDENGVNGKSGGSAYRYADSRRGRASGAERIADPKPLVR